MCHLITRRGFDSKKHLKQEAHHITLSYTVISTGYDPEGNSTFTGK